MSVSRKERADRKFAAHFKSDKLNPELRAERACTKYRHELEKLMDCTMAGNLKNHGFHGYIPTPKRKDALATISKSSAISYLRSTGSLRVDTVKQTRHIVFGGRVMGKIGNDIMTAILEAYPHTWERIAGTNVIEYKFVK